MGSENIRLIGITGILGAGKTTIGRLLAKKAGFVFIEEEFAENPYLVAFHKGETDFFACQMWFFERDRDRYEKGLAALEGGAKGVVVDKPFFENRAYNQMAPLTEEQRNFFDHAIDDLVLKYRMPDVLVDIETPTSLIMQRVSGRGREAEQSMPQSYIEGLQEQRERFKSMRPKMRTVSIDADLHDFVKNPAEIDQLAKIIFETKE